MSCDAANRFFQEYQTLCYENKEFLVEETKRFDQLDKTWKGMTRQELAKYADYVTRKIFTAGSAQDQEEFSRNSKDILLKRKGIINSSAVANMAHVCDKNQDDATWEAFYAKISRGDFVVSTRDETGCSCM